MPREIISEVAGKPYSRGTRNGNMIFVSGQMGLDGNDKEIPGGVGPQMVQTMEYIKEILAEAGATLDDVMMTNVYMLSGGQMYIILQISLIKFFLVLLFGMLQLKIQHKIKSVI